MVDNFELISPLLNYAVESWSYFLCQVIRRKKDSNSKDGLIKSYIIRSKEELLNKREEIITLCETFKARAYISLSRKSLIKLQKTLLKEFAEDNLYESYPDPVKRFQRCAAIVKADIPRWIVDIDEPFLNKKDDIIKALFKLWSDDFKHKKMDISVSTLMEVWEEYIYEEIPTKSGIHLITRPFNRKEFYTLFPDIDVHVDNGTVLYIPNSLDV